MFSDILTPLPALGIEFDVVRGSGPIIEVPIRRLAPGLTPSMQRSTFCLQMICVYHTSAAASEAICVFAAWSRSRP